MDVVACFVNVHLSGEVGAWLYRAIYLSLGQYAGYRLARRVGFDQPWLRLVVIA